MNKIIMLTIRTLITAVLFICSSVSYAQSAKDTIISGISYNHVTTYANGKLKEAGNYDAKKMRNGQWISFDTNGEETESGSYLSDKKDGQWWYHKSEIVWYDKGKVKKTGSGCKDCPGF